MHRGLLVVCTHTERKHGKLAACPTPILQRPSFWTLDSPNESWYTVFKVEYTQL